VTHNIPLLKDVIEERRFREGDISTKYLEEVYPDGFSGKKLNDSEERLLAAVACCVRCKQDQLNTSFQNQHRIRNHTQIPKTKTFRPTIPGVGTKEAHVTDNNGHFEVSIDGHTLTISDNFSVSQSLLSPEVNGQATHIQLLDKYPNGDLKFRFSGTVFEVSVLSDEFSDMMSHMPEKVEPDYSGLILAPMPGLVKSVNVQVGDMVSEGTEACVLEAMKMQNSLVAAKTAKVKAVHFSAGETVGEGDVIVELEDIS